MITPAAYCRYSSDNQRQASIADQLRNIQDYCDRMDWPSPDLYKDEAISGMSLSREGYNQLIIDAQQNRFNVLLVDDLYRLGRDFAETPKLVKLLKFWGIRVIGVTDGIDTDRKGYKIEVGLRGIMGEAYLDDLAEKTHRGLKGQALAGYNAGGLSYGYTSENDGNGYKLVIAEEQAKWVLFMFEKYAGGWSTRSIASHLNELRIPSARGSTWAMSAIYGDLKRGCGILANPLYIGQHIWNRTKWVKDPATSKRKRIQRPETDWIIVEDESLRIIPQDLWNETKARQKKINKIYIKNKSKNPMSVYPGPNPKYLFSGLLKCAQCGGNFILVDRHRYGCSYRKHRGNNVCSNDIKVSRHIVEDVLLRDIKRNLLNEDLFKLFEKEVRAILKQHQPDPREAKKAVKQAKSTVDNIMNAIRQGIITPTTKEALADAEVELELRQQELREIEEFQPTQILPRAREIYKNMVQGLENIEDIPLARTQIKAIIGEEIVLKPEGNILVAELKGDFSSICELSMVAGASYVSHFTTLEIPLI